MSTPPSMPPGWMRASDPGPPKSPQKSPPKESSSVPSLNQPPTPPARTGSPALEASRVTSQIPEHSALFDSSRKLTKVTEGTPLLPKRGEHATDVYFFRGEGVKDVVFKPGHMAANRSEICYGLARIIGITDALVPAKRGTATVIASRDENVAFKKMTNAEGYDVLVNTRNAQPLTEKQLLNQLIKKGTSFHLAEDASDVKYLVFSYFEPTNTKPPQVLIGGIAYDIQKDPSNPNKYRLVDHVQPNHILGGSFEKVFLYAEGEEDLKSVLVPVNHVFKIGEIDLEDDATTIDLIVEDDIFSVNKDHNGLWTFPTENTKESNDSLVYDYTTSSWIRTPQENVSPLSQDENGEYVMREGLKYSVEKQGDSFKVVGRNVPGMVQAMVEHTFTAPAGRTKSLNLLAADPVSKTESAEAKLIQAFYARIDMPSFVRAFIATILLRPQDGKVTDLSESNILFQAIPAEADAQKEEIPLRPVLIDLDETIPPANDYTQNPDYLPFTHAVRCGLMAFPQARTTLAARDLQTASDLITEISNKRHEIGEFLRKYISKDPERGLTNAHLSACTDVIMKMSQFIKDKADKPWSLEELFFYVFPEYKQQWDILGPDVRPEEKAAHIGFLGKNELENHRSKS